MLRKVEILKCNNDDLLRVFKTPAITRIWFLVQVDPYFGGCTSIYRNPFRSLGNEVKKFNLVPKVIAFWYDLRRDF